MSILYEALKANEVYQIANEIKLFMMLGEEGATQTKNNIEEIIQSKK